MKPLLLTALILAIALPLHGAGEVTTVDGQVLVSSSLRRSGSNVMVKVTTPEGGSIEMGIPIARIVKVSFDEPPELARAMTAADGADANTIISLTSESLTKQADFKDVPGAWWIELAKLRLLALAGTGKDADAASLAREIGSIKGTETESLARSGVLFMNLPSGDNEAIVLGSGSIPKIGGGQSSALAQLALGKALLAKKDYPGALRCFLTIKVFYPSISLLQPAAQLGAAKAYIGLKDEKRALRSLKDLSETYPSSPLSPEAKKLADSLSST